ncbi:MAG: hypothetical protein GY794_26590, partial [bacterium]|nr:hypothetical protein [bacterium]
MKSDINSAICAIPAHDRETWVRVGMAIHGELGSDGFGIWDEWSQGAGNYSARAARDVWRSFKPGSIGVGTLFHLAR